MKTDQLIKSLLASLCGIYFLLVFIGNITDYNTNFEFIKNVLLMETVFHPVLVSWKAIRLPTIWHISYLLIIILEFLAAIMFIMGTILFNFVSDKRKIKGNLFIIYGYLIAIFIFFGIFTCIAGEWFLMWQQPLFNAQSTALKLSIIFSLFIYIHCNLKTNYEQV